MGERLVVGAYTLWDVVRRCPEFQEDPDHTSSHGSRRELVSEPKLLTALHVTVLCDSAVKSGDDVSLVRGHLSRVLGGKDVPLQLSKHKQS